MNPLHGRLMMVDYVIWCAPVMSFLVGGMAAVFAVDASTRILLGGLGIGLSILWAALILLRGRGYRRGVRAIRQQRAESLEVVAFDGATVVDSAGRWRVRPDECFLVFGKDRVELWRSAQPSPVLSRSIPFEELSEISVQDLSPGMVYPSLRLSFSSVRADFFLIRGSGPGWRRGASGREVRRVAARVSSAVSMRKQRG